MPRTASVSRTSAARRTTPVQSTAPKVVPEHLTPAQRAWREAEAEARRQASRTDTLQRLASRQRAREKRLAAGFLADSSRVLVVRFTVDGSALINLNSASPSGFDKAKKVRAIHAAVVPVVKNFPAITYPVKATTYLAFERKDRHRDPENWAPSRKAVLDALVMQGILEDDNSDLVTDGGVRDARYVTGKGHGVDVHVVLSAHDPEKTDAYIASLKRKSSARG